MITDEGSVKDMTVWSMPSIKISLNMAYILVNLASVIAGEP